MHRRLTWVWEPPSNWIYSTHWVGTLRPARPCLSFQRSLGFVFIGQLSLLRPMSPYPTPSSFTAIQSEAMTSQQRMGRFNSNIPMCGHARPSEEERVCYISPWGKKNAHIRLWNPENPEEMKCQDKLKKFLVNLSHLFSFFTFGIVLLFLSVISYSRLRSIMFHDTVIRA